MRVLIAALYEDWICLDERLETIAGEIETIGEKEANCRRLMSVPDIGPLIYHPLPVGSLFSGRRSIQHQIAPTLPTLHRSHDLDQPRNSKAPSAST
jgi:transposase